MDKIAQIISSGSKVPGTILKYCSQEFAENYHKADLIISKGQGNYETLNQETKCIYFFFRAKCPVVAQEIQAQLGDIILKKISQKNTA